MCIKVYNRKSKKTHHETSLVSVDVKIQIEKRKLAEQKCEAQFSEEPPHRVYEYTSSEPRTPNVPAVPPNLDRMRTPEDLLRDPDAARATRLVDRLVNAWLLPDEQDLEQLDDFDSDSEDTDAPDLRPRLTRPKKLNKSAGAKLGTLTDLANFVREREQRRSELTGLA